MNKKTSLRASMSNSCSLLILEMVRILSSEKRNGHYSELRVSRPRSLLSTKSRFRGRQLTFGAPSNPENGPQNLNCSLGSKGNSWKVTPLAVDFHPKTGWVLRFPLWQSKLLVRTLKLWGLSRWVVFLSRSRDNELFFPIPKLWRKPFSYSVTQFRNMFKKCSNFGRFFYEGHFPLTSSWSNRRSILEIITNSEVSLANCRIRDQIPNETRDMPESPALSRFPISPPFYLLEMTLHNRLP